MTADLRKESLVVRLKNLLNENDIKLWLPPYFETETSNSEALQALADTHSVFLDTSSNILLELLQDLQIKSLQRLQERNKFKTQGLATIRIKVSNKAVAEFSVQIMLSDIIENLKKLVAEKIGVTEDKIKLIFSGKVLLSSSYTLEQIKMKHGSVVLALILLNACGIDPTSDVQTYNRMLEDTRNDVEVLLRQQKNDYLTITNQSGAKIDLPEVEKRSLCLAMSFHEKGRTALKKKLYELALMFFIESDNEFKQCRSDILHQVDNYALVNLDIVWTYLHLRSLQYLSDGEERLRICDKQFERSYGRNLERLTNVKGNSGNEKVLLTRLRLLQGIFLYYVNRKDEAIRKFNEVENNLKTLKVDAEKINTLVTLGFSSHESLLALRATNGNLDMAVEFINKSCEAKKAVEKFEKIRNFADKYPCENGDPVNLTVLNQMFDMGYTRLISVQALRECNNKINSALLWVQNFYRNVGTRHAPHMVDVLKQLEFDDKDIASILKRHEYKLDDNCVQSLLASRPELGSPFSSDEIPNSSFSSDNADNNNDKASHLQNEFDALKRLNQEICSIDDDYLIIDLESEEMFLREYQSLL